METKFVLLQRNVYLKIKFCKLGSFQKVLFTQKSSGPLSSHLFSRPHFQKCFTGSNNYYKISR